MNPKEYIQSGKLESYILGSCTQEELQEVECMARVFPEIRLELEVLRSAFETYALSNQVTPSQMLKSKIFAAIEEDNGFNSESNQSDIIPPAKVIKLSDRNQNATTGIKLLIAACLTLLVASTFIAYNLYRDNQKLNASLADLIIDQQKLQTSVSDINQQLQNSRTELLVLSNPNSISVAMKGLPLSPQSLATVYWNKESKEVYLSVNSLPSPPEGKQYQLWAIVNSTPVDLGVFELNPIGDSLLQKMKTVDNAATFAVTLENKGGSPSPTLDQMYVAGNL